MSPSRYLRHRQNVSYDGYINEFGYISKLYIVCIVLSSVVCPNFGQPEKGFCDNCEGLSVLTLFEL